MLERPTKGGDNMDEHGTHNAVPDPIMEEAALWFSRLQLGTADIAAFERWRAADPRHAVHFAKVANSWLRLGALGDRTSEAAAADAVNAADTSSATLAGHGFSRRAFLRAAGFAGLILGGALVTEHSFARDHAFTRRGERRTLTMPDASTMSLNAATHVSWRFNAEERMLWLETGEIALDLRAGPALLLHSGDAIASLTSGYFNARLDEERLDLLAVRGAALVTLGGGNRPVMVKSGQQLVGDDPAPLVRPTSAEQVEAAIAWQSGEILFLDEPLTVAVARYNRLLARPIRVVGPELARIRVGGRFTSSNPEAFLKAVAISFPVRVTETEDEFLMTSLK